jgi:hypothetical protein
MIATGIPILADKDYDVLGQIATARTMVDMVSELGSAIAKGEDTAVNTLRLDSIIPQFGVMFSRSIFQDRGATTDRDVDRVSAMLPGWKSANFAPGKFKKDIQWLKQMLNRINNVTIRSRQEGPRLLPESPSTPSKSDKVRMKKPDGTIGYVPKSYLEAAKQQGYVEVP